MSADVRDRLTRLAGQPADPQPSPEHPPAGTQPVPQPEPPASPVDRRPLPKPSRSNASPLRAGCPATSTRPRPDTR